MALSISEFQQWIRDAFGDKDAKRGVDGTFLWFMEEVGELATALRSGTKEERAEEFADVLAWLVTLANTTGIDLEEAARLKYAHGCPTCRRSPCTCDRGEKP
jgi:NTP pyrophosphatase (non-canonical NTP hydrolase)